MSIGVTGATALGLGGYSLVEPYRIRVSTLNLHFERLPTVFEGFRIAQLSDLHFGPYTGESQIGKAIAAANAFTPHILAVTGDFVTAAASHRRSRTAAAHIGKCAELLGHVHAPWGKFAVLGNHDHWTEPDYISEVLTARGFAVLRNRALPLQQNGGRIWIAGLDDAVVGAQAPQLALGHIPANEFVILLAHEPDVADDVVHYPVGLQLSGHSHGGQVRLPGIGRVYVPPLARKYPAGLYRVGNIRLYTNCGIGVIGLPVRFNCPPEVTYLTLRALRPDSTLRAEPALRAES